MSEKYIPAIDGMRAVAIGLVVGSHFGLDRFVPGGFGVTLFFFISGFLITGLLIKEHEATGTISISSFYVRRFLRLAPALVSMIALVSVAFYIFNGFVVIAEICAGLFYYMNYYLIFGGLTQMPLGALWSLAVEEHYYLIFPAVIALFWRRKKPLIAALILLCVLVLLWRAVLVVQLHSPMNRTYLSTDTRIDSIIFGAILAAALNTDWQDRLQGFLSNNLVVLSGFLLLLLSLLYRDPVFRETIRYTLQGIALIPIFYATLFAPSFTFVRRILESPLAIWLGKLSYAIYLWHTGVQFFLAKSFVNGNPVVLSLLELALSIALAAGSYYFVEVHFQRLRQKFRLKAQPQLAL